MRQQQRKMAGFLARETILADAGHGTTGGDEQDEEHQVEEERTYDSLHAISPGKRMYVPITLGAEERFP